MWEAIKTLFSGRGNSQGKGILVLVIDDGEVERKFMTTTLKLKICERSDGTRRLPAVTSFAGLQVGHSPC